MVNGGTPEAQQKYLLIARIAASELFQKAPRLRHFFQYVAECTLDNRLADVREQVIAERVFNRQLDLHGGQDSIVRAEARNLRKRLKVYFETEGKDEPVVVSMPKGGYSLAFVARFSRTWYRHAGGTSTSRDGRGQGCGLPRPPLSQCRAVHLIRAWNVWEFTDAREMTLAGLILRSNAQFAQRIALRSGHEVQLQDLKEKSVVLIGSPISNPWAQVYEEKLNFRCEMSESGRIVFLGYSTLPGTIPHYPDDEDVRHNRCYSRLAFLPRTPDAAPALLIAGTTSQLTEAAGQLVMDRSRLDQMLRSMGVDPAGPPHFFEILIRSNNFVGGAMLPEVVAWRVRESD